MAKIEIADNTGIVTFVEMQRKLGYSAMTLKRKINSGELPPLDFGSNNGRAKFWMRSTLEEFFGRRRQASKAYDECEKLAIRAEALCGAH